MHNNVTVKIGYDNFLVAIGSRLIDLADAKDTPLDFMCREGACGVCAIEVIKGNGNLSEKTEEEDILLPIIANNITHARLACQVKVLGNITIRPLEDI